jgi:hypothetical protein
MSFECWITDTLVEKDTSLRAPLGGQQHRLEFCHASSMGAAKSAAYSLPVETLDGADDYNPCAGHRDEVGPETHRARSAHLMLGLVSGCVAAAGFETVSHVRELVVLRHEC